MSEAEPIDALDDALLIHEVTSHLRHALRNRLASIRNATFYVQRKLGMIAPEALETDPRLAQMLAMIDSELGAAEQVLIAPPRVAELLEAARGDCDALAIAHQVLERARRPSGVSFAAPRGSTPVMVRAGPRLLAIALESLVSNAIDAVADRGGTVEISISRPDEKTVGVEVSDDGPGFRKTPPQGTDLYPTTKRGHLGVGLMRARRAALVWNGQLELHRSMQNGAKAMLFIPSADGTIPPPPR